MSTFDMLTSPAQSYRVTGEGRALRWACCPPGRACGHDRRARGGLAPSGRVVDRRAVAHQVLPVIRGAMARAYAWTPMRVARTSQCASAWSGARRLRTPAACQIRTRACCGHQGAAIVVARVLRPDDTIIVDFGIAADDTSLSLSD